MNRIGLDFGTTYSLLAYIDDSEDLKTFLPGQSLVSPYQPSIVTRKKDRLSFSFDAKGEIGKSNIVVYKGFKMMLTEKHQSILEERGYDNTYTPETITESFIRDLLVTYVNNRNRDNEDNIIEKLVIGAPEIWFNKALTIDCRSLLKDICAQIPDVTINSVQVVSEPAAACAFFVYNYKKKTNQSFKGHILLIDYGGGTLDIALCEVTEDADKSRVTVKKRTGAGMNEEFAAAVDRSEKICIGSAGIAFMEEVIDTALLEQGFSIDTNTKYYNCVNYLEDKLISKMDAIKNVFDENIMGDAADIPDEFCTIEYKDTEIEISYGALAQAYDKVIAQVLEDKLNEVKEYMENNGIGYGAADSDSFKIALVGGFCNFYLTQSQVEKAFDRGTKDRRFEDIIYDRRECEKAIAYGAALIANDIINFNQRSPYDLGFATDNEVWIVIRNGSIIKPGAPQYYTNSDGSRALFYGISLPKLAFEPEDAGLVCFDPRQYGVDLSLEDGTTTSGTYQIGLSLDESLIIYLHTQKTDGYGKPVGEERIVRLNELGPLYGGLLAVKSKDESHEGLKINYNYVQEGEKPDVI